MFTGIISDIGTITATARSDSAGDLTLTIQTAYDNTGIKLGESIACNGCCLTVVQKGKQEAGDFFVMQLSDETLECTADKWSVGDKLNLERALKMGDDLSGHLVSGHVDGVATVLDISKETGPVGEHGSNQNSSHVLTFKVPTDLSKFIAPKGSVTLNGVSLTVNAVDGDQFTVNIIPHTWEQTNLSGLVTCDTVNIEIDLLARYVVNMLHRHPGESRDP